MCVFGHWARPYSRFLVIVKMIEWTASLVNRSSLQLGADQMVSFLFLPLTFFTQVHPGMFNPWLTHREENLLADWLLCWSVPAQYEGCYIWYWWQGELTSLGSCSPSSCPMASEWDRFPLWVSGGEWHLIPGISFHAQRGTAIWTEWFPLSVALWKALGFNVREGSSDGGTPNTSCSITLVLASGRHAESGGRSYLLEPGFRHGTLSFFLINGLNIL